MTPTPSPTPPAVTTAPDTGDPPVAEETCETVARRLYAVDFSWDIQTSLQFALFRTYAVPSISGLLARTGEFDRRPRKRYDDTELILAEVMEHGRNSARGQRAIARMNAMHGRYRIDNADMLYVLSTFICEPIRWLDRFGRRRMTDNERQAWVRYYHGLGTRVGIGDIPTELSDMMRWNEAYEAAHFRYADSNRQIAEITRDLLLGFYLPRPLVRFGRPLVHAVLDDPLRVSMGFPKAPNWVRGLVSAGLRLRAAVLTRLPARRRPRHLTELPHPTYPEGYRIEELGTFPAPMPDRGVGKD